MRSTTDLLRMLAATSAISALPSSMEMLKPVSSGPTSSPNRLSQKGRRRRARQKLSNCGRRVRK